MNQSVQCQMSFYDTRRNIPQSLARSAVTRYPVVVFKELSLPHHEAKKRRRTFEAPVLRDRRMPLTAPTHRSRAKIDPTLSHDRQWHGVEVLQPEKLWQQHDLRKLETAVFNAVGKILQPVELAQR